MGIQFKGTLAVITLNNEGQLQHMYIGAGDSLRFKETKLNTGQNNGAAFLDMRPVSHH